MASLRSIALFSDLNSGAIAAIERGCRWRDCVAGELILHHHDSTTDIYFVTAGRVRAVMYSGEGKTVAFRDISAGDMFGELAAVDGEPRSASIVALEDCRLGSLGSRELWRVLADEPDVMRVLMLHLVAQIRALTMRVYEFSTLAVPNRIQAELLRLARSAPVANGAAVISPAPLQSDIADRISTHREAVAREFSRLVAIGLIRREGRALLVTDVDRLKRMVDEANGS